MMCASAGVLVVKVAAQPEELAKLVLYPPLGHEVLKDRM